MKKIIFFFLLSFAFSGNLLAQRSGDNARTESGQSSVVDQIVALESKMSKAEMPTAFPIARPFANNRGSQSLIKAQDSWVKNNPQQAADYVLAIENALTEFKYDEATMTPDQKKLYKLYKLEYHFLKQQIAKK